MGNPLKHDAWKPTNVMGYLFMVLGLIPGGLWVLDYVDVIRPGERPTEWPILLMSAGLVGLGALLVNNEASSIGEAFLGWFGKGKGGGQ